MTRRHPGRLSAVQQQERAEFVAARDAALAAGEVGPLREWVARVEAREEARQRLLIERRPSRDVGGTR